MTTAFRAIFLSITLTFVSIPTCNLFAASFTEIDIWSKQFSDAVSSGETEKILSSIEEVRDNKLDQNSLRQAVTGFCSNFKTHDIQYTIRIRDQNIDDLYRRFTTAAIYDQQHLYYTTTFIKTTQGWKLISIQMNTDVNKVLFLPWPQ